MRVPHSLVKGPSSYRTLPPLLVQPAASEVSVQPWPLQEFWPLQDDEAVLQALVPLQELMPPHFTLSACAAEAKVSAAKIAAAVVMRVFLVMSHSLVEYRGDHAPPSAPPGSQGLAMHRD